MISVCMIAWNEEQLLPSAIASTAGLADEVIVVDTGSSDKTIEVARELGAHVVTGADRMHKGFARNQAIETASGDWVVVLDADEQIADPEGLRAFLEATDADAVYVRLAFMIGDRPTLSYAQMRCWRRDAYRYRYRAHEVPAPVNGWGKIEHTDFIWEHRPPQDRLWKSEYTRDRLLLDVAENPDDARPKYYLGRQYMYRAEWQKAVEMLEQYLETPGHDEADAWQCLSKCCAPEALNDEKRQIRALHQACAAHPMRREWWCTLAALYHGKRQDQIAVGLLKCALEIPAPERAYVSHYWYGSAIYDLLARCLYKLARYAEGQTYAEQALALEPDNERLQRNLLWFKQALGDMDAFYQLYGAKIHSGCGRHQAIAALVKGPKVMDVGCGTGDLLILLQDRGGFELFGTDISQVALDMAQERGLRAELYCSDKLPDGTFDTIVMAQVIEHVEDDAQMVKEAANRLADGGLLIVSVPNGGRIPAPDHKREYTAETLMALLGAIGEPMLYSWSGERDRLLMSVKVT